MPIEGEYVRAISRRVTRVYAQPNNGSPVIFSDADSAIVASITHASIIDNDGIRSQLGTSSVLNDIAQVKGDTMYRRGLNVDAYIKFKLNQNTNVRFFAGLALGNNSVSADQPSTHLMGIGFSSAAGDSTFKFLHGDGPTLCVREDTFVPWSSGIHELFMHSYKDSSGAKIVAQLDNSWRQIISSRIPGNSISMHYEVAARTLTNSAKSFEVGYMEFSQEG